MDAIRGRNKTTGALAYFLANAATTIVDRGQTSVTLSAFIDQLLTTITADEGRITAIEELIESDYDGAINKFNEIVEFLEGISASDLSELVNDIVAQIDAKYTKPAGGIPSSDLAEPLVHITQAAYDALSTAQKNNGSWYFIEE
jgi:hypothetical protein